MIFVAIINWMNPVRDQSVMHYVYVLKSTRSGRMYTGSTNNLRKRFKEHNDGKSNWTKKDKSWKLIYYEACLDEKDTRTREIYLKSGMGKRYLRTD